MKWISQLESPIESLQWKSVCLQKGVHPSELSASALHRPKLQANDDHSEHIILAEILVEIFAKNACRSSAKTTLLQRDSEHTLMANKFWSGFDNYEDCGTTLHAVEFTLWSVFTKAYREIGGFFQFPFISTFHRSSLFDGFVSKNNYPIIAPVFRVRQTLSRRNWVANTSKLTKSDEHFPHISLL